MNTPVLKSFPCCRAPGKWMKQGPGRRLPSAARAILRGKAEDINSLPLPNGRMGWPLIGRTLEMINDLEFPEKLCAEYGPVAKMSLFGEKTAMIAGIENIRKVAFADPPVLGMTAVKSAKKLMGSNALYFKNGKEHQRLRSILMKTMCPAATAQYIPYIAEAAQRCLETMAEADGPVSFQYYMRRFALDVVVDCMTGIDLQGSSREELFEILMDVWGGLISLGIDLPFTKYSRSLKARKRIVELIRSTMRSIRQQGGSETRKVLQMLMDETDESGNSLLDEEIVDSVLNLLFAGYDTSASTAMAVLFELQQDKEVIKHAIKEQEEIVSAYGEELTSTSLGAMRYLDAIVKETLRINPTVKWAARRCLRSFSINGYRIPEGWQVIVAFGATGKMLDNRWKDDFQFDPSRFLREDGSKPGSQIPWGIGAHNCAGQVIATFELKIFFALLFRDYDFHTESKTKPNITSDVGGMPTTLTKRLN